MQITKEQDILDQKFRKMVIDSIGGQENQARKAEAYRRYLCFKDRTDMFVIDKLAKQFDQQTIDEMGYAMANISFVRKIIEKLARVYNAGVERTIGDKQEQSQELQKLEKSLQFNTQIKTTNKFLKLQRNLALYIKPCPVTIEGEQKWTVKLEPLNPYLYDVLEDPHDKTKPMVYILSDYHYQKIESVPSNVSAISRASVPQPEKVAGEIKGALPDREVEEKDNRRFIWWSENHHFTTDANGEIIKISEEDKGLNPIKELPFVNFAIDQDGEFWALGGDDLVDGAILINCILTHNQHVGVAQGYGQFWMSGKGLPRAIKVGPTKSIILEHTKDDPTPQLGFANANPQLDALRGLVESYIALLLTTNNLSTSAVGSQLGQSQSMPSGIAMIIDKAESMEDVQDQRQVFIDKEPAIWRKVAKWMDAYKDHLVEDLKGIAFTEEQAKDVRLKFLDAPMIMSEKEKLENMKLRKDLGLDSMIDMIMKDNPGITRDEAEEKLRLILEGQIKEAMIRAELREKHGVEDDAAGDNSPDVDGDPEDQEDGEPAHDPKVAEHNEDSQDGSHSKQDDVDA